MNRIIKPGTDLESIKQTITRVCFAHLVKDKLCVSPEHCRHCAPKGYDNPPLIENENVLVTNIVAVPFSLRVAKGEGLVLHREVCEVCILNKCVMDGS